MGGSDSSISLMTESDEGEEETREERGVPSDDKDFFEDQATQWAEVCARRSRRLAGRPHPPPAAAAGA